MARSRSHPVSDGDEVKKPWRWSMGRLITEQIIGAAFEVYSILGYGFLERVYQRSMQVEVRARGLKAEIEDKIKVWYKKELVGDDQADLWVADSVIVELKVGREYHTEDEAQLLERAHDRRQLQSL